MRIWQLSLAVLLLMSRSAFAADDAAIKADLEKFKGEWSFISATAEGMKLPIPPNTLLTIEGNKMTTKSEGQSHTQSVTLDPTANPKQIDAVSLEGPEKGTTSPGIYEFNGDELKLCMAPFKVEHSTVNGKPTPNPTQLKARTRPKSFDDQSGVLLVLRRKPAAK